MVLPTFPGFDGTPQARRRRLNADTRRPRAEFIGTQTSAPCDVIGHSFGGWVAMWLAVRHPGKVDHLVLETPAGLVAGGKGGLSK